MRKLAAILGVVWTVACATGGSQQEDASGGGDRHDAGVHLDGHNVAPGDGPITPHDAPNHPLDAFVPQDAPDQGGEFCADNTGCSNGNCCFVAICVMGTGIGSDLCFPAN